MHLIHLEVRDVFKIVFFVSQREHYIFLEGVDWCHIPLHHKEGTSVLFLSSAESVAGLVYYVQ